MSRHPEDEDIVKPVRRKTRAVKEAVTQQRGKGLNEFVLTGSQKELVNKINGNVITFVDSEAGTGKSSAVLYSFCKEYLLDKQKQIDGSFLPPLPPPPTPITSVTRRQFKQALTRIGLRAAVEAAIAAADQDTKDWYADSLNFERSHPVMNSMAVVLGKTQEDIDILFKLAETI